MYFQLETKCHMEQFCFWHTQGDACCASQTAWTDTSEKQMAECWKLNLCKRDFMLVGRRPEGELPCTKPSSLCLCTAGHFTSAFIPPGFLTVVKHSYRAASISNTIPYLYPNLEESVPPWQNNAVVVVYTLSSAKHQYNTFEHENIDIWKTI